MGSGTPADAEAVVRERLAAHDVDYDPETVAIDDAEAFLRLDPAVREWWLEAFADFVPENGGVFTPPQKGAIPRIDDGTNTLVCAPTGSGKCVRPDTPLIISEDNGVSVIRAEQLLDRREEKVANIDEGQLHESSVGAFALNDGTVDINDSLIYSEPYDGDLFRLRTTYGREVEVTPSHPLLVETENGREWREACEITEGDKIGVPNRIDLPERRVDLPVEEAIAEIRDEFETVLTFEESDRIVPAVRSATELHDISESDIKSAMALADLTMDQIAERISVGISSVHGQVTHQTEYRAESTLEVLRDEIERLASNEVLVRTSGGQCTRFRYPDTVTESVAELSAFVLAEGYIGDYERSRLISISQKRRTDLLKATQRTMEDIFGMQFSEKGDIDYVIASPPFAMFFSRLLGIGTGPGRGVPFPDWLLNAPRTVKQTFVSTFLSLEAEVRENEIRVTQANEMKIEQLIYLFLSFGVFPARHRVRKGATNTESEKRDYYRLIIRGKDDLRRSLSEFDIQHPNVDSIARYAERGKSSGTSTDKYAFDYKKIRQLSRYYENDESFNEALGNVYEVTRRSGYITESGLERISSVLDGLPDDDLVSDLADDVDRRQTENLSWVEITSKEPIQYEGEIVDLNVPGPHNFVGGRGGMYLHNTLASFCAIIDDLFERARTDDGLVNSVHCLYVSPLKSLANDIHRNLDVPLDGITEKLAARGESVEIRHAIRHGDTSDSDRNRMLEETPHILNTTPETLAILLNSPKFKEKLRTVEYVIVDEIHSLADNKRGTHLAVSLERLEAMCTTSPTRIGCSATVEPLDTIGEFLVGGTHDGGDWQPREYDVVDARFVREFDMELTCPTADLINTPRDVVTDRFYDELAALVADHTNTLVFTNTRSGAERVLHNLRERGGVAEERSGCHHGSLSKDQRTEIEQGLKAGDLDVVTTSTSLELGIDMPYIDLVVQVGSPKSVAALLQRVGRAGHQLGQTVKGRVVALDRDELVECAVMLKKAEEGFVDRVFVPENCDDVAVQHVYGMAINGPLPEAEVRTVLRSAYPYRGYDDGDFERLFRYLTADYEGMEDRSVYAKVWRDENDPPGGDHHYEDFEPGTPLVGKRGRMARVIYMTNIGTIPDSFTCDVFTRSSDEWVGELDEEYLDTLEAGDVFVLGGDRYQYRYRRGSKVYVERTSDRATVPSWYSERLPLSYDLGREILAFQRELLDRLAEGGPPAVRRWLRGFPTDENTIRAITRMFESQVRYAGPESVSTDRRLAIEVELDRDDYRRNYYVHSNYGRRFNDGLSRLLAYRCAQAATTNVTVSVADHGFTLSMPLNRKIDLERLLADLEPGAVRPDLRSALEGTDLLQRYFRINATRSLMILKRYKGHEKSASQQQVSSEMLLGFAAGKEAFAVMEETYREILEDRLDVDAVETFVAGVKAGTIDVHRHRVQSPSPRAFGLATLNASDVVLAEDESAVLQEFHDRVMAAIDDDGEGVTVDTTD